MILCCCANVNERQVAELLRQGPLSLTELQRNFPVAQQCGRCREAVCEALRRFAAERG